MDCVHYLHIYSNTNDKNIERVKGCYELVREKNVMKLKLDAVSNEVPEVSISVA